MGVGAGPYVYDVVVKEFTFAISSLISSCIIREKYIFFTQLCCLTTPSLLTRVLPRDAL